MTKFTKLAVAALFAFAVVSTTASADVAKGQKLYSKKLKAACGFTGAKFAAKHTQDEWKALKESGKMGEEIATLCPSAKFKDKWADDIFDFANEYASDSGNVPSC